MARERCGHWPLARASDKVSSSGHVGTGALARPLEQGSTTNDNRGIN